MNIFDQINQDSKDEIIAKRSECSKTFKVSPGNEKLVHFFAPVHYKNDINNSSEGFKDINLEIVEGVDYFEVTQTPYHLKIFKDSVGFEYESKRGGKIIVRLKSLDRVSIDDLTLNINPEIIGDRLYWKDVFGTLDIYVQLKNLGIEVFKILKTEAAAHEFEWEYEEFDLGKGHINKESKNLAWDDGKNIVQIVSEEKQAKGKSNNFKSIIQKVEKKIVLKDKKTRIKSLVDGVVYPVLVDAPDISESIGVDTDDGYEKVGSANWAYASSSIPIGSGAGNFNVGFRFRDIQIPIGTNITSAKLNLKVLSVSGTPTIKVYGDDVNDAAVFSNSNLPSNGITKTTASYAWSPSSTGWKDLDITTIVSEIVERVGWVSSNNMRFGLFGPTVFGDLAVVADYVSGSVNAAYLEVMYNIEASASLELNTTANLSGTGHVSGEAVLELSSTANLTGTIIPLASDTNLGLNSTANLSVSNLFSDPINLELTTTGVLGTFKRLSSSIVLVSYASASLNLEMTPNPVEIVIEVPANTVGHKIVSGVVELVEESPALGLGKYLAGTEVTAIKMAPLGDILSIYDVDGIVEIVSEVVGNGIASFLSSDPAEIVLDIQDGDVLYGYNATGLVSVVSQAQGLGLGKYVSDSTVELVSEVLGDPIVVAIVVGKAEIVIEIPTTWESVAVALGLAELAIEIPSNVSVETLEKHFLLALTDKALS